MPSLVTSFFLTVMAALWCVVKANPADIHEITQMWGSQPEIVIQRIGEWSLYVWCALWAVTFAITPAVPYVTNRLMSLPAKSINRSHTTR